MIKKPATVDADTIITSAGLPKDVTTLGTGEGELITGPPGPPGEDGADGYTPIKGVDYFDGEDGPPGADSTVPGPPGANGADGYTPVKDVDYFDGNDGAPGVKGDTGDPGSPGADGHSPVVAFGTGDDADRLTIDGTPTGPHLTGPQGEPGTGEGFEFPVGWVLISTVNTNPATFLGYGTWASFGAGRVLVGLDSGDTDFDTAEETGGAKTVNLAHTHALDHSHTMVADNLRTGGGVTVGATAFSGPSDSKLSGAQSIVQPYVVVYMWKRTE